MKKIFLYGIIFLNARVYSGNFFTDQFFIKEQKKENPPPPASNYYCSLLPESATQNFDLSCIKTREGQSLDDRFLAMIKAAFSISTFIELSTYLGDTTQKAATHFATVHTIESRDELIEQTKKRFLNQDQIHLHHGDIATIIPQLRQLSNDQVIFFIDSPSQTIKRRKNEAKPIIKELEIIQKSNFINPIIVIDDIRMFYKPLVDVSKTFIHNYPTLNEIVEKILAVYPTYQCAIIYDTLIAFPAQENITVSPLVKAITMSRLYDGRNYNINDVIAAELCIAHAQGQEKVALINLAELWIEKWSEAAGLSRHYSLWYGLILMVNEEYGKAHAYFKEAKKRGLTDWRIDWYLAMAESGCFFDIR